jgi:hypothetical protein
MDLNSGDLKLEMKIFLKIDLTDQNYLQAKSKFYTNSKILTVLAVKKYSLEPLVVSGCIFPANLGSKIKKSFPCTNKVMV